METDYENYTLVSSCGNIGEGHVEYLYFLVREREWPDQNKEHSFNSMLQIMSIIFTYIYIYSLM